MQTLNGWKAVRNADQRQPLNAPLGQQTFEQRRGPGESLVSFTSKNTSLHFDHLDTTTPLPLASWQNRV